MRLLLVLSSTGTYYATQNFYIEYICCSPKNVHFLWIMVQQFLTTACHKKAFLKGCSYSTQIVLLRFNKIHISMTTCLYYQKLETTKNHVILARATELVLRLRDPQRAWISYLGSQNCSKSCLKCIREFPKNFTYIMLSHYSYYAYS